MKSSQCRHQSTTLTNFTSVFVHQLQLQLQLDQDLAVVAQTHRRGALGLHRLWRPLSCADTDDAHRWVLFLVKPLRVSKNERTVGAVQIS